MALLGLEHGLVAMAVGAATGKRSLALAIAGGIAVAGYMFYALGAFVDAMEPWRVVSPFFQALEGGPIGAGVRAMYVWMPTVGGAALLLAALPLFSRRDIAA
jgi:ABC-2 type transport system permease protein